MNEATRQAIAAEWDLIYGFELAFMCALVVLAVFIYPMVMP